MVDGGFENRFSVRVRSPCVEMIKSCTRARAVRCDARAILSRPPGQFSSAAAAVEAAQTADDGTAIAEGLESNTQVMVLESALRSSIGDFTEQRVEYVGPKVGAELREDGIRALLYSHRNPDVRRLPIQLALRARRCRRRRSRSRDYGGHPRLAG